MQGRPPASRHCAPQRPEHLQRRRSPPPPGSASRRCACRRSSASAGTSLPAASRAPAAPRPAQARTAVVRATAIAANASAISASVSPVIRSGLSSREPQRRPSDRIPPRPGLHAYDRPPSARPASPRSHSTGPSSAARRRRSACAGRPRQTEFLQHTARIFQHPHSQAQLRAPHESPRRLQRASSAGSDSSASISARFATSRNRAIAEMTSFLHTDGCRNRARASRISHRHVCLRPASSVYPGVTRG